MSGKLRHLLDRAMDMPVTETKTGISTAIGTAGAALTSGWLQTAIGVATLVLLVGQIVLLTPKYLAWYRDWKRRRFLRKNPWVFMDKKGQPKDEQAPGG